MTTKTPTIRDILSRLMPENEIPELTDDELKHVLGASDEDLASLYVPETRTGKIRQFASKTQDFRLAFRRTGSALYVLAPQTATSAVWVLSVIPNGSPERDKAELVVFRPDGWDWYRLARTFPAGYFGGAYPNYEEGLRALKECRDLSPGDVKLLEGISFNLQLMCGAATTAGALLKHLIKVDPVGTPGKIEGLVKSIKQEGIHGPLRTKRLSTDSNSDGKGTCPALQHDSSFSSIDDTPTHA